MLFYSDDPMSFDAKVLRVLDDLVILDRTSFYARGGGQEPDYGTISGSKVVDVNKHGGVILHKLAGQLPKEGETVPCIVDEARRSNITKNHTSTHILNASSRKILGSWVWQHSAFKDVDHARLDITHHSSLTKEQEKQIEDAANEMVNQNIPVTIEYFDRGTAEQKYGFRIYQGGVVPVKSVRIVSIQDKDIEACGGTHVKKTGEIKLIKIKRTKRIQDGVVRIEFVSGPTAKQYDDERKRQEKEQFKIDAILEHEDKLREDKNQKAREKITVLLEQVASLSDTTTIDGFEMTVNNSMKVCFTASSEYDEFFHTNFGKKLVKNNPNSVYVGIFEDGPTIRIMAYCGDEAANSKNAGEIAKSVSEILGGAGGGDAKFAQGGGKDTSKKDEAIEKAKSMILG